MNALDTTYIIEGDGTSLWGKSDKKYIVEKYIVNQIDYEEGYGEEPYELQLFGSNTEWYQYTDQQIEKQVNQQIVPYIRTLFPQHNIKSVGWSEQGMQPDKGWSFDIIIDHENKPGSPEILV